MAAASSIINIVKCKRPDMVVKVEALCDAYITLANMDATPWKTHRSMYLGNWGLFGCFESIHS